MKCVINTPYQREVSELSKNTQCSVDEQLFGFVTVGERGQVVIPAEARKRLNIQPGEKLIVMAHPFADGVVLAKIDSMREFLSTFLEGLSGVERRFGHDSPDGGSPPDAEKVTG